MPRANERKSILTEIGLESASGKREARISDLSRGGCFVDTIITARVGEEVTLRFSPNSEHSLELSGRIAYILDGFGFGVMFNQLSVEAQASLDRMLAAS